MTKTTALEKLLVSLINTLPVVICSLPFLVLWGFVIEYRIALAIIFLTQQLIIVFTPHRRSLGMIILNVSWNKTYTVFSHLIYALLYSLSFSTIVFWVVFPFDVLILNLLFVQLPMVYFTGYTLHGYLSGKMSGHKNKKDSDGVF